MNDCYDSEKLSVLARIAALPDRLSYVLGRKWFPGGTPARLRAFWHYIVRGYRCEICGYCGRPVGLVWHAPDELWAEVNGQEGGCMCVPCFNAGAQERGHFIRWDVGPL